MFEMTRCLAIIAVLTLGAGPTAADDAPIVAGYIERVVLPKLDLSLEAKLDTGAQTSSLHAEDITIAERNGTSIVQFTLQINGGAAKRIELPLVDYVEIRRANVPVKKRPVVETEACVGGFRKVARFTLTDRSEMSYPVLIGRRFMGEKILVNSGKEFLKRGACDAQPEAKPQ